MRGPSWQLQTLLMQRPTKTTQRLEAEKRLRDRVIELEVELEVMQETGGYGV